MGEWDIDQKLNQLNRAYEKMPKTTSSDQILKYVKQQDHPKFRSKKKLGGFSLQYVASFAFVFVIAGILATQFWNNSLNRLSGDQHKHPENTQQLNKNETLKQKAVNKPSTGEVEQKVNALETLIKTKETELTNKLGLDNTVEMSQWTFDQKAHERAKQFKEKNYQSAAELDQNYRLVEGQISRLLMTPSENITALNGLQEQMTKSQFSREVVDLLNKMKQLQTVFLGDFVSYFPSGINPSLVDALNGNAPYPKGTTPSIQKDAALIIENGYMFIDSGEGMVDLSIDYVKLNHEIDLPAEYATYADLEGDMVGVAKDAAITVSWDQLSDLIVRHEKFIEAYPDFEKNPALYEGYKRLLTFYLKGIDNTPTFNFTDHKLNKKVEASYQRFLSQYADTKTYKVVKDYYELLKKNHLSETSAVKNYQIKFPVLVQKGS